MFLEQALLQDCARTYGKLYFGEFYLFNTTIKRWDKKPALFFDLIGARRLARSAFQLDLSLKHISRSLG
ncbi:MAG: hypothetical protein CVU86_00010 [Firmicutes bacterium HGW-Firmicutes-11]|jgi:hypothetical protein|nr:MAG: hypothetical protein CVU86_00010 [Firmicutes bacterium HGW-Firmicutes-11]